MRWLEIMCIDINNGMKTILTIYVVYAHDLIVFRLFLCNFVVSRLVEEILYVRSST